MGNYQMTISLIAHLRKYCCGHIVFPIGVSMFVHLRKHCLNTELASQEAKMFPNKFRNILDFVCTNRSMFEQQFIERIRSACPKIVFIARETLLLIPQSPDVRVDWLRQTLWSKV